MHKNIFTYVLMGMLLLSFPSFGSLKSEEKKFKKLRKEWIYKSYSKISKGSIKGITSVYNLQAGDDKKLTRANTHALLAYMWGLGINKEFAIADSKMAVKKAKTPKEKYIAETSLATALYNRGWGDLARSYTDSIKENPDYVGIPETLKKEELLLNLMVGSLAIKSGDLNSTHAAFSKIALETNKPWIPTLAMTSAMILNGSVFDTPGHINTLINDPTLTSYEREKLVELKALSVSKIDHKNKKMGQLINSLIFESIRGESDNAIKELVNDLTDYMADINL